MRKNAAPAEENAIIFEPRKPYGWVQSVAAPGKSRIAKKKKTYGKKIPQIDLGVNREKYQNVHF